MGAIEVTETFTRFDAADYLTTDEGVAAFLDAAAEGNDPGHLAQALATVARARNMSQLARDAGITREGLYKALAPDGNPGFATVVKIAGALGLRVAFVPATEPARSSPTRAELLATQAALLEIAQLQAQADLHRAEEEVRLLGLANDPGTKPRKLRA